MQTLNVITRPGCSGKRLQQSLCIAGLNSVHLPGLKTTGVTPPVTALASIKLADWWFFTSPASIKYANQWLQKIGVEAADYPNIAILSRQSAIQFQTITDQLKTNIIWPSIGHRSEDLLNHPQLQNLKHQKIIIFNAIGGRQLLADSLIQRGADVQQLTVYQRTPALLDKQPLLQLSDWTKPILTLWTSNTSIQHLQQQLSDSVWQKLMSGDQLLLSNRQKTELKSQCTGKIHLADAPDNQSLQQQIMSLCK